MMASANIVGVGAHRLCARIGHTCHSEPFDFARDKLREESCHRYQDPALRCAPLWMTFSYSVCEKPRLTVTLSPSTALGINSAKGLVRGRFLASLPLRSAPGRL